MDIFGIELAGIVPFIAIGFAAQLVDGALGMAFGVITNTLLVGVLGLPPAQASQRVHVVECFTTATSGISHLLSGNIDRALFLRLLIPGMAGGITGAYLLTAIDASIVEPVVLAYLAVMGLYLLARGLLYPPRLREAKHVAPLGLVGGFLDAAGGGGWGPVVTSNLLVQGAEPRKVVGTVNAVEFFLALTISATFVFQIGIADLAGATLGLLIGGIAAAPLGAVAARRFSPRLMLVLVGTALSATSAYGIWAALA
ncbi:sulfite exporter TauE/SafE family protein [Pelagerythrobacter marinus]|uniref:sulfite exporter TauE/SafE family protein n=1 Tax=Pelagerythrobacter marinus TaxID=538382 RepID=UPI0020376281|nr:sulfite exporter TauE/SafE family protein [Pelagerythrobacter marinus]USA38850.1 sulfite exporter TauE/SafE family protein [Pelagerythrobacter marinus]WPZ07072.1 sulfite exporter TauE/SafE family protein [Pelagerythrobacter marinus]